MIVCWVLFALSATFGLVGWAGYEDADAKLQSYAEQHDLDPDSTWAGITQEDLFRADGSPTPLVELRHLQTIRYKYWVANSVVLAVAPVILLWNIIWHFAHWIKTKQKANDLNQSHPTLRRTSPD